MSWGYSYNNAQPQNATVNAHFGSGLNAHAQESPHESDIPEPSPQDLHADWNDAWAPNIKSTALRSEMAANPRLADRIARLKVGGGRQEQGVDGASFQARPYYGEEPQETYAAGQEASAAVLNMNARRGGRSRAGLASPYLTAYEAYIKNPSDVVRQAGLIWNAASFARIIDGAQLRELSQIASAKDLERAFSYIHLSMPTISLQQLPPDRLQELLRACGERAAFAWASQLPEELQMRVLATLPRIASTALPDQIYRESAIMQAALETRAPERGDVH